MATTNGVERWESEGGQSAVRASKPKPLGKPVTDRDRDAMVAEAAYRRAEQRGFAPGHELDDWLAAEVEVDRRFGVRAL